VKRPELKHRQKAIAGRYTHRQVWHKKADALSTTTTKRIASQADVTGEQQPPGFIKNLTRRTLHWSVQCAKAELQVFATAGPADLDYVRGLGAEIVVNYKTAKFEDAVPPVDAVLDTVGGETQHRSFLVLKPGGILVSSVSPPPQSAGFRSVFLLVDVTATRLGTLARLLDSRKLIPEVGTVLELEEARMAHEMLAGAPHKRGKIVLTMHGVP
jgi:hypothetical protein